MNVQWIFGVCVVLTHLASSHQSWLGDIRNWVADKLNIEFCNEYFTSNLNDRDLAQNLSSLVFGQPFVHSSLLPLVLSHRKESKYHNKALVLSFHGSQGTGKNFVARIIVEHLYRRGLESKFVRYFNGRMHFTRESKTLKNIEYLEETVYNQLRSCGHSVFIFDEVEKFPTSILDRIKSFIDYDSNWDQTSSRNALFIFLSNSGMEAINKKSYELWTQHVERKDFKLHDFQELIAEVYRADGALKNSALIRHSLIDLFVPFLPLEESHVVKCIKNEAQKARGKLKEGDIAEILSALDFQPEETKTFSRHGCKNIKNEVLFALRRDMYKHDEF